jgi:hypothetical protein
MLEFRVQPVIGVLGQPGLSRLAHPKQVTGA